MAHIVTLKDNNDEISYPITPVDAVFVDSNTTLSEALDDKADADLTNINAGSVTTAKIADGAVTSTKITNGAVTAGKINWSTMPGNYSLSEIDTGYTWIDGKTIYKKTIEYTGGIASGNNNIPHGISNIKMVINKEIFGYRSSDTTTAPLPMYAATNQIGNWTVNSTYIQINATFSWSDPVYITLYYTKTS